MFSSRPQHFITLLILILMVCGQHAWGQTWDGTTYTQPTGEVGATGTLGSETNPYIIDNAAKLAWLGQQMKGDKTKNGGTYGGKYWKITADIDLGGQADFTGVDWTAAIGHTTNAFYGFVDGKKADGTNAVISNIQITATTNGKYYGLFLSITGKDTNNKSSIENLSINGVYVKNAVAVTSNTYMGTLAGTAKWVNITNCQTQNVTYTSNNSITKLYFGGFVGYVQQGSNLLNCESKSVNLNISHANNSAYFGGFIGYMTGALGDEISIKDCSSTTTLITVADGATITTLIGLGGFAGYQKYSSIDNCNAEAVTIEITPNTPASSYIAGFVANIADYSKIKSSESKDVTITVNGNVTGATYLSGFVGYSKGTTAFKNKIKGNVATNPSITLNGVVTTASPFIGGLVGYVEAYNEVLNNKVVTPTINITNTINANTYVGGAIGSQTTYTDVDGLYVKGGTISGPTETMTIKNAVNFFVGGAIGQQNNNSANAVGQPQVTRNVAVEGMTILMKNYEPAGYIIAHKFAVGGVMGQGSYWVKDTNGRSSIPENLICKDTKIFAPYASVSATVGTFNGNAATHENYVHSNNYVLNEQDKSKRDTWLYKGYQLGVSQSAMTAATTAGKQQNIKDDATWTNDTDADIKWLTVTDDIFKHTNSYLDNDRFSRTVLWWTYSIGTEFATTEYEQNLYPISSNKDEGKFTTVYKHYPYFYQGVNYGKYSTNADKVIEGIDANVTQAKAETPVTLTIEDANATQRGFDAHSITVTPSTGSYTYKWYVDGVEQSETSATIAVKPDFKYGKGIVVNAMNGETIVASTNYTLNVGVLKTKTATDVVGMPLADRGTSSNPYIIDCPEALKQLSYLSTLSVQYRIESDETLYSVTKDGKTTYTPYQTAYHYNRAYYELSADIDLKGNGTKENPDEFTPISHASRASSNDGNWGLYHQNYIFQGHFDGKGYAIKNFKIIWYGGAYRNNYCQYFGLFGALGNPTAQKLWGESTASSTVVQNLIIENAQLIHKTTNTTFSYQNPKTTNGNHVYLGVLTGVLGKNVTVQNVEVRGSKITDAGSSDYDLASKTFSVGGIAGRIQNSFNSQTDLGNSAIIRFASVDCDIDLQHATFASEAAGHQILFNVGGVVGSIYSNQAETDIEWPSYTYYIGKVNAPNAMVGPLFSSVYYSGNASAAYADFCKHYMAKTSATAERTLTAIYYGNGFQIHDGLAYQKITDAYPTNVCDFGARTIVDSNTHDAYVQYGYQGVNYGEYIGSEYQKINTEVLFENQLSSVTAQNGYYFVFDGNRLSLTPTPSDLRIAIMDNDASDANATTHTLSVINNRGHEGRTYTWFVNGEVLAGETGASHSFALDATPRLVYVKLNQEPPSATEEVKSDVVDIPRLSFSASYSPSSKLELSGPFDGTYVVTPNANFANASGFSFTYEWKEKQADGSWGNLSAGTSASACADGKSCSITGASEKGVYQCKITATDTQWADFLTNLTDESSPYYSNKSIYEEKYPVTLDCDLRVSLAVVVFLHPTQSDEYGIPAGKDDWTATEIGTGVIGDKLHPVRTWGKAYSLLDGSAGATWEDNIIVLVGTSETNTTWGIKSDGSKCNNPSTVSEYGLSNVFVKSNGSNEVTHPAYDNYIATIAASPMGKNVTITGVHDGVDYHAQINSPQIGSDNRKFMNFYGNTKFEHLTFYGTGTGNYDAVFGHYHDLYFGEELIMKNYQADNKEYGTIAGVSTPRLQIFGGMNMDARFTNVYDAATGDLDRMVQKTVPNGEKGFTLTFRSGYYSIICVGSRQTDGTPGTQGSPNVPIKCTIDVDLDQTWNTTGGHEKTMPDQNLSTPYDIALIMAGNHEGGIYADVDIKVKSGRIARIVNGSLGARTTSTFKYGTGTKKYPLNTFMGRASILLDPASSTQANSHITDINRRVIVTELYNGGVGRSRNGEGEIDMPSLGRNTITMRGGTIGFPDGAPAALLNSTQVYCGIYGGGAGGANGIGYDENHTNEQYLPYWDTDDHKAVLYGDYATYKAATGNRHLTIKCYNADTDNYTYIDPLETSSKITIEGCVIGTDTKPANVYGTGSGFTSTWFLREDHKSYPCLQAGNMYGSSKDAIVSTVNITGGTIYGNVYGAGKGTDYYYANYRNSTTYWGDEAKSRGFTNFGQTYGSVEMNISGNALIYGNVYGAGAGVAEAKFCGDGTYGQFTETALLAGNSTVNISGNAQIQSYTLNNVTYGGNVYGGGMLAKVSGKTTVNISGNAHIDGNVFGAAQGITRTASTSAQYLSGTQNTYLLNNADNCVLFGIVGDTTAVCVTGTPVIAGDIYGGAESAYCGTEGSSSTHVTINVSDTLNNVYGGGLGRMTETTILASADVLGDTRVDMLSGAVRQIYGGNNVKGLIHGNTHVYMQGGSVIEDIYGGGALADVQGDTYVTIQGGTVIEDVYGGGALADVQGDTYVNLLGGSVYDVYGGGLGRQASDGLSAIAAKVRASTVNVGRGTYNDQGELQVTGSCVITGSVFGCNNLNGTPMGNATVNVYRTNPNGENTYHVPAVYGGGNKAAYDPEPADATEGINADNPTTKTTLVEVFGCDNSVQYVYGGGNAAPAPATHVIVHGGDFDYVFGGGNGAGEGNPGANVGYYTYTEGADDADTREDRIANYQYGTGRAETEIYGGQINHLFGGSNTKGNIREVAISQLDNLGTCAYRIGEAYAAGNEAYMDGKAIMNIGCIPGMDVMYGGAKKANINDDVVLTITGGTYGRVFGGNNEGGTINGSITVNIEETGCKPIIIGEVYGGGNLAAYTTPKDNNDPTVNIRSCTKIGSVFGGGYGTTAAITGNTHVNVQQVQGKWATDGKLGTIGMVYGGGNAAPVVGNTYVHIATDATTTFVSRDKDIDEATWQAEKTVEGAEINAVTVTIPASITGGEAEIYTGLGNVYGGGLGTTAVVQGTTHIQIGQECP